jgi:hypothetical protein
MHSFVHLLLTIAIIGLAGYGMRQESNNDNEASVYVQVENTHAHFMLDKLDPDILMSLQFNSHLSQT